MRGIKPQQMTDQLAKLDEEIPGLRDEVAKMKEGTEQYDRAQEQLARAVAVAKAAFFGRCFC